MEFTDDSIWIKRPKQEARPPEIISAMQEIEAQLPHIWRQWRMLWNEKTGLISERDRKKDDLQDIESDADSAQFNTKMRSLKSAIDEQYKTAIANLEQRITELETQESEARQKHAALSDELRQYSCIKVDAPRPSLPSQRGL